MVEKEEEIQKLNEKLTNTEIIRINKVRIYLHRHQLKSFSKLSFNYSFDIIFKKKIIFSIIRSYSRKQKYYKFRK